MSFTSSLPLLFRGLRFDHIILLNIIIVIISVIILICLVALTLYSLHWA